MVFCEVAYHNGTPHESNTRNNLIKKIKEESDVWVGFEQEFTLYNPANNSPLGFLLRPESQGPYYCGVGCIRQIGRYVLDEFEKACIDAGLPLDGVNAEVMPGQWEFQTQAESPLKASDDLWMARYILDRLSENQKVIISYDPKPKEGWNGAGCHTNFSTSKMRDSKTGLEEIKEVIELLSKEHTEHLEVYGDGIGRRLTGKCETSSLEKFTWGIADRGASIRIPYKVHNQGYGYLEDRRPNANIDPYRVTNIMLKTAFLSPVLSYNS